jgi:hypothetical protein
MTPLHTSEPNTLAEFDRRRAALHADQLAIEHLEGLVKERVRLLLHSLQVLEHAIRTATPGR